METKVPSLKSKVQEKVHPKVAAAIAKGGTAGKVARTVARTIHGHEPHIHDREVEKEKTMTSIPQPLKLEHEELHGDLSKAIAAGGKVGEAASRVATALHAHFEKEEEYALPPLGLLPALAEGKATADMAGVVAMTDKLKADLPHMLEEHGVVVAALEKLIAAAEQEGKPEHAHFAERLMMHARTEEEVTYPTAILVGEYVKLKLQA